MGTLFDFRNIHLAFDGKTVLGDVTTSVPDDRLTVVAGASGSGKTTLLRLCNRLEVPDSGEIRFRGQDLLAADPQQLRRDVGMVFQRPVMFAGTVRDNLLVGSPDTSESGLVASLRDVELDQSFLDRVGDDLSGGEAQRVCLARALLCEPEVLLMDEPTASLHEAAARGLESTAARLKDGSGVAVVWVTHDLRQIERLAEHLMVLEHGRVRYAGDPDTSEAKAAIESLSSGKSS